MEGAPSLLPLLTVGFVLGLLTLAVITTTSFVKIAVVLFLVRNALGIQQTPPNIVLYGISLVLTLYIGTPVLTQVYDVLTMPGLTFDTTDGLVEAARMAAMPVQDFMSRLTHEEELAFFVGATSDVWGESVSMLAGEDSVVVLAPAFLITELKRAFEIGFLLYLPFVVIDLVVTTILMAMGMSMVSPTIISTPFKVLLFVAVDGWSRLVQGLVMSYV